VARKKKDKKAKALNHRGHGVHKGKIDKGWGR
jgi:hypothetical protein